MSRPGAAVALVALLAAGCSAEHAGSLPPVASPSSATPSATATASTPAAQVEAAARAYFAELTRAGHTGDTRALRALVTPQCGCRDAIGYIEEEHRAGHHFTTDYRVDAVRVHDVSEAGGSATVTVTYAASQVVDAQGRTVRRLPGVTRAGRELGFRREGERWLLTRYVLLGGG